MHTRIAIITPYTLIYEYATDETPSCCCVFCMADETSPVHFWAAEAAKEDVGRANQHRPAALTPRASAYITVFRGELRQELRYRKR